MPVWQRSQRSYKGLGTKPPVLVPLALIANCRAAGKPWFVIIRLFNQATDGNHMNPWQHWLLPSRAQPSDPVCRHCQQPVSPRWWWEFRHRFDCPNCHRPLQARVQQLSKSAQLWHFFSTLLMSLLLIFSGLWLQSQWPAAYFKIPAMLVLAVVLEVGRHWILYCLKIPSVYSCRQWRLTAPRARRRLCFDRYDQLFVFCIVLTLLFVWWLSILGSP
jgi:hypothetical protein